MTEHSKEVMERRRQGFEAAIKDKWPDAPTHWVRDLLPKDDPKYGDYVSTDLRAAWIGFNIALDSLVIELPALWAAQMLDGDQVLQDCRYAIESTGLGLRVKA